MDQASTVERNVTAFYDTIAPVISVDASGEYAVLGGLRGLNIIDLESPFKPARILHHHSQQSGTTVVRWNPKISHLHLLASTSNLNILIWNLERQSNPLIATFQAHARSVNDIAWSPLDPNRLASCDANGCVYIWDLRSPGGKPTHAFRSVAKGTAQIQWNRHSRDLLASAHENQLEIWDMRGGLHGSNKNNNFNLKSVVAAHRQAIYGLDWSYNDTHELLTCSEDKSVKFWRDDVEHEISTLQMPAPVWKTRYTPFGSGIVTIAKRNDPVLRLWNLDNVVSGMAADLVQVYSGHEGSVRSFDWRYSTTHNRYQLISWGDDKKLRFFRVERHHVKECGHVEDRHYASRRNKLMKRPVVRREKAQVEKYDPLFLKNDLDDLDNYDTNMMMGGGGGGDGILDGGLGMMETYGSLIDMNNGMGVENVGQQHKQQFAAEVEEWEEWSVAARSLEEEFDIIKRHLGGVMSGITGAVVSIDPQTLDRRCIVECVVRRESSFASAIVAFSFPENYLVDTDQPYKGCPMIDLIDGSPRKFVSLHWDNIAQSMRRLAKKRAVKGKRSLEILMRRLARSLARFVDGKLQDSSSLFQMEDVGGIGNNRFIDIDDNSYNNNMNNNLGNISNVNSSSNNNLLRGGCGIIFSRSALLTFGNKTKWSNNTAATTVTIVDISNLLEPLNMNLAKSYSLNPRKNLKELNLLCTNNAKTAKAHGNNVADEAWSIIAGIVHPTISSPLNNIEVLSQWQRHPLGQRLTSTLIERLVDANDIQTIAVISAALQKTGLLTSSVSKDCERIRHIYANLLYRWGLFNQRALLLKYCLSGSVEAEPQSCLKEVVCNVCTLTCRGYVAMCIFCGHGGHQKCYRQWHNVEIDCPSGCGCKCKLMFSHQQESTPNDNMNITSGRKSSSMSVSSIHSTGKKAMNDRRNDVGMVEDDDDDDDESSSEEEEEIEEVGQRSWRN
jgi:hypothetical protein